MQKVLSLFLSVLVLGCFCTIAKQFHNGLNDIGQPFDFPSVTVKDSEKKRIFCTRAHLNRSDLTLNGKKITFGDCWIESKVKTNPYLIWWNHTKRVEGYYILITTTDTDDILETTSDFLELSGSLSGFASRTPNVFYDSLTASEYGKHHVTVELQEGWNRSSGVQAELSW